MDIKDFHPIFILLAYWVLYEGETFWIRFWLQIECIDNWLKSGVP